GTPGSKNPGVQAREKVLEAIAPMRRGRPVSTSGQTPPESKSRTASPQKEKAQQSKVQNWLDDSFAADEEKAWKAMKSTQSGAAPVRGHRSGTATLETWKVKNPVPPAMDPTWSTDARANGPPVVELGLTPGGFDNDFAEKLWNQFESDPKPLSNAKPMSIPGRSALGSSDSTGNAKIAAPRKVQDAFDGLGLSPSDNRAPPQTLGEARKTRTGLASMNGTGNGLTAPLQVNPSGQASRPSSSLAPRPTPSPRNAPTPNPTSSSWKPSSVLAVQKTSPSAPTGDASPETRFPSVEELDAKFSPSPPDPINSSGPTPTRQPLNDRPSEAPVPILPRLTSHTSGGLRPKQQTHLKDGVRSQQVTGIAMRDPKGTKLDGALRRGSEDRADVSDGQLKRMRPLRPSLSRRHRSSITIKRTHASGNDVLGSPGHSPTATTISPRAAEPKDWLTGDDDAPVSRQQPPASETPVLREFTNKRSSYIESGAEVQSPQEAVATEQPPPAPSPSPTKSRFAAPRPSRALHSTQDAGTALEVAAKPKPVDNQPTRTPAKVDRGESSSDEGPEDVNGYTPPRQLKRTESKKRKGRQSSVHDLVDLWGGGVAHPPGDYLAHRSGTLAQSPPQSQPPQRRPSYLPPASNQRSASPQPLVSSPSAQAVRPAKPARSPSHHRKLSAAATPAQSSPSGRGRPQSMFIFPVGGSKSDSTALSPPMLSPPPDSTPNRTRTSSITDMVQRYEAFGGKAKGPESTPPLTPQKPVGLKVATNHTSTGSNPRQPKLSQSQTHSPMTARPNGNLPSRPSDTAAPLRQRATGLSASTGLPSTSGSSPAHRESLWTREVDNMNAPSQRTAPDKLPASSNEAPSFDRQSSQFAFPARRPSAPPPADDSLSPASPEKPYQGVGKLIDQWQRKTTVAPEPDTRRSGFAVRGAGRGRI
ncbi:hypothetical protein HWV62_34779, partial [Athelia sp. TMB]